MPKHECKHPNLSGPEFAHLGHFRNPKFVAQGHNQVKTKKLQKEEEDEVLRQAEESIRRLEEAGFGKTEEKPLPKPKPAPKPETDIGRIEERIETEKKLGLRRGLRKF